MALHLPLTDIISPSLRRRCPRFFARAGGIEQHEAAAKVVRLYDPLGEASFYPLVSGPVLQDPNPATPLKQQKLKEDENKRDFYVNLGYSIRKLRDEIPNIFYREPSFDIYRDDIVFRDPLNTFMGIDNYKLLFWALRFNGKIFFKALWVDVISVWQPTENIIMIKWTVHGIPRVPWESRGRFDATSEYKLDKNGKIYEHKVDNVAFSSPPRFKVTVEELIQRIGGSSTPKPTYFEMLKSGAFPYMPVLLRSTWTRCYLAFYMTLTWLSAVGI